jgi:hypothetical protein
MSDERKRILQMLAEGKISADEAERLLAALGERASAETDAPEAVTVTRKPKFLHVKVQAEPGGNHRHKNVDIKVPIMLLKAGMKLGTLLPEDARAQLNTHLSEHGLNLDLSQLDSEKIDILIQALTESSIDIDADDAQVKIFCA